MNALHALNLAEAPSDTVRAHLIDAVLAYAQVSQMHDLREDAAEALAAMTINPYWRTPAEWQSAYLRFFALYADPDQGVDLELAPRYCNEYWQALSDGQRQQRYDTPDMGKEDAILDAKTLNEAGTPGAPTVSMAPPAPPALYPSQALLFDGTVASANAILRWACQFQALSDDDDIASYTSMDGSTTTDDLLIAVGDEDVPVPPGTWILRVNNDFLLLPGTPAVTRAAEER